MKLNKMIDHTILKADATELEVLQVIEEAKQYDFFSVCINPTWVKLASEKLAGSDVKVCTVIGFPLGANTSEVKAYETKDAIHNGANEVDMVLNIGALKADQDKEVQKDIEAVVAAADGKALVKVIIESAMLTDEQIVRACKSAVAAGANFVKTSTGFAKEGGASVHAISLMRQTVGPNIGVKASGGVHSYEEALALVEAGASRIGASASIAISSQEK
ncbi:deoxyribose-phosphate aldolase [Enterococcus timonensis]|uniref:deoxyribose-phosphate aldolase n=1 Tax=Enterococcus timonensis TaxID=1852364 RepID=UPI0008DB1424|nr:deoxyribose-phosphate aldolase [Enterococcus timonensis]